MLNLPFSRCKSPPSRRSFSTSNVWFSKGHQEPIEVGSPTDCLLGSRTGRSSTRLLCSSTFGGHLQGLTHRQRIHVADQLSFGAAKGCKRLPSAFPLDQGISPQRQDSLAPSKSLRSMRCIGKECHLPQVTIRLPLVIQATAIGKALCPRSPASSPEHADPIL